MGLLYIIRHGQASFGAKDYDNLSPLGNCQARLLGAYLKDMGVTFHQVFSGTHKRQIDTARLALEKMNGSVPTDTPKQMEEFDEMDVGEIIRNLKDEMILEDPGIQRDLDLVESDLEAFYRVLEKAMIKTDHVPSNHAAARSIIRFKNQVETGLSRLVKRDWDGQNTAVFTSAGTTATILRLALCLNMESTIRLCRRIWNSSVTVFLVEDGRLNLVAFNDTAHLAREKDAALLTLL